MSLRSKCCSRRWRQVERIVCWLRQWHGFIGRRGAVLGIECCVTTTCQWWWTTIDLILTGVASCQICTEIDFTAPFFHPTYKTSRTKYRAHNNSNLTVSVSGVISRENRTKPPSPSSTGRYGLESTWNPPRQSAFSLAVDSDFKKSKS
jgi:hypothetical protein